MYVVREFRSLCYEAVKKDPTKSIFAIYKENRATLSKDMSEDHYCRDLQLWTHQKQIPNQSENSTFRGKLYIDVLYPIILLYNI